MSAHPTLIDDPVLAALDRAEQPVRLFIRDDDTGWADERLFALLDVTAAAGVPIDLAAIPQALNPALVQALKTRLRAAPVGVHQHGLTHHNHEPEGGRKCEFGAARGALLQRQDLSQGRSLLQQAFGERLDDFFTPPWNRCAVYTPGLLAELGFAALSRDATATPQQALPEITVHTDWSKHWKTGLPAVLAHLASQVSGQATIGLMLHHAVMSDEELQALAGCLARWARHPQARWLAMRDL